MIADDFREIVLSLEGTVEGAHMNHPDFRANGRVFASLKPGETEGVVRLSPAEQAEVVRTQPKTFVPAAGAWGRQGWTIIQLAGARPAAVRGAVLLAWQGVLALPRKKSKGARTPAR
jgi:hypothetical protein